MALVKYNNNSISAVTAAASIPSGSLVLIKSQTASSSANISFIHGTSSVVFDGTYNTYMFKFIDIHPASAEHFTFNATTDGTNFNVTKTTTYFHATHNEGGSSQSLSYVTGKDLAQSTDYQRIIDSMSNANDECGSGTLFFFSPASTTFVKHFISNTSSANAEEKNAYVAGYMNTTSAITGIDFKMSSGNIDSGTIKLYGIKDS
jgi:hypothetical protein